MTTTYSKTVTADGYEWTPDPAGTHRGIDRGAYIEMIPLPKEDEQDDEAEL